jgi:hypothetical protein
MTEQTNWRKRLVRAGIVLVVTPVLLSSGYAGTLLASRWAVNHGLLTYQVPNHQVFMPLRQYEVSDLPGSVQFDTLSRWLNADGRIPWQSVAMQVERIHRGEVLSPCQRES